MMTVHTYTCIVCMVWCVCVHGVCVYVGVLCVP